MCYVTNYSKMRLLLCLTLIAFCEHYVVKQFSTEQRLHYLAKTSGYTA